MRKCSSSGVDKGTRRTCRSATPGMFRQLRDGSLWLVRFWPVGSEWLSINVHPVLQQPLQQCRANLLSSEMFTILLLWFCRQLSGPLCGFFNPLKLDNLKNVLYWRPASWPINLSTELKLSHWHFFFYFLVESFTEACITCIYLYDFFEKILSIKTSNNREKVFELSPSAGWIHPTRDKTQAQSQVRRGALDWKRGLFPDFENK